MAEGLNQYETIIILSHGVDKSILEVIADLTRCRRCYRRHCVGITESEISSPKRMHCPIYT